MNSDERQTEILRLFHAEEWKVGRFELWLQESHLSPESERNATQCLLLVRF